MRSSWSEPQSASGLVFANCITFSISGYKGYNQSDFNLCNKEHTHFLLIQEWLLVFCNVRIKSCWQNCFDYRSSVNSSFSVLPLPHELCNSYDNSKPKVSFGFQWTEWLPPWTPYTNYGLLLPLCPFINQTTCDQICGNLLWISSLPRLLSSVRFLFIHYLLFFYFSETWQPWIKALLNPITSEFHIRLNLQAFLQTSRLLLCLLLQVPQIETDVSVIHYVLQGDETRDSSFS